MPLARRGYEDSRPLAAADYIHYREGTRTASSPDGVNLDANPYPGGYAPVAFDSMIGHVSRYGGAATPTSSGGLFQRGIR